MNEDDDARHRREEAERRAKRKVSQIWYAGEFGMGTAGQYGEADLKDRDFSGQVVS